jgi:hypothetical protein
VKTNEHKKKNKQEYISDEEEFEGEVERFNILNIKLEWLSWNMLI